MNTQTKTAINPFATAQKKATTTKKSDLPTIQVKSLDGQVEEFCKIKGDIDDLEAQAKMLEGIIKETAKSQFMETYLSQKSNPGSFKLQGTAEKTVTVSVQDKYKSIDENAAAQISREFGDEMIEVSTEYSFNSEILERNFEAIGAALASADISEDDMARLLSQKKVYAIKKGSIDRILISGKERAMELFQAISPIVSVRV
jgi:hypothetical protein